MKFTVNEKCIIYAYFHNNYDASEFILINGEHVLQLVNIAFCKFDHDKIINDLEKELNIKLKLTIIEDVKCYGILIYEITKIDPPKPKYRYKITFENCGIVKVSRLCDAIPDIERDSDQKIKLIERIEE